MRSPIRVLELRSACGAGGGPEKTILAGAAATDPRQFAITVCYIRDLRDRQFSLGDRARTLGLDYVEIQERHSYDSSVWTAVRQLVRDRGIDIVHAHDHKTDLLALALGVVEPVVPLATAHGWTGHSLRERFLYYPADRRVLARFPQVIAVSADIRDELLRAGADPECVTVILNGVDHRVFRRDIARRDATRVALGIGANDVVIGSIGRLEPQKRFDILIDVFAAVRATHPHVKLVIAGDGSLREDLARRAEALIPGGAALLLGHRTDVIDLLNAFDLFVQSSDYEGTPNAVLEAMAAGTAVIATDAGGTAQLVIDGVHGTIVPKRNPRALRDALMRAIAAPGTMAACAAAARDRVERELSFDRRCARLEALYEQLCDTRGRQMMRPRSALRHGSGRALRQGSGRALRQDSGRALRQGSGPAGWSS
jgi:glycosyltransferase involved in cell wall biosynthesis